MSRLKGVASTALYLLTFEWNRAKPSWCLDVMTMYLMPASFATLTQASASNLTGLNCAASFNPVKFDADAWVRVAKDAGMRYIVITSKHHDGFALFHSKVSKYNAVDATPFKRDILKELSEACARQGMRLGFYYS